MSTLSRDINFQGGNARAKKGHTDDTAHPHEPASQKIIHHAKRDILDARPGVEPGTKGLRNVGITT